jgi:hypothetical protein
MLLRKDYPGVSRSTSGRPAATDVPVMAETSAEPTGTSASAAAVSAAAPKSVKKSPVGLTRKQLVTPSVTASPISALAPANTTTEERLVSLEEQLQQLHTIFSNVIQIKDDEIRQLQRQLADTQRRVYTVRISPIGRMCAFKESASRNVRYLCVDDVHLCECVFWYAQLEHTSKKTRPPNQIGSSFGGKPFAPVDPALFPTSESALSPRGDRTVSPSQHSPATASSSPPQQSKPVARATSPHDTRALSPRSPRPAFNSTASTQRSGSDLVRTTPSTSGTLTSSSASKASRPLSATAATFSSPVLASAIISNSTGIPSDVLAPELEGSLSAARVALQRQERRSRVDPDKWYAAQLSHHLRSHIPSLTHAYAYDCKFM